MSGLSWSDYYMKIAMIAACKSKDETKVGAILVGPNGNVCGAAFNGPPRGVEDKPKRFIRPEKYLYASHAEANLIAFSARVGTPTAGCSVYVTHHPCASCARTLIQAGVSKVVYGSGKTSMPDQEFIAAADMFSEAGVRCEAFVDD